MKLTIHAHQIATPRELTAFIRQHLVRPLARLYDNAAAQLEIHFDDPNGSKGGLDRLARITFRMPGARAIHLESLQDDLHKAVLDAADRLKRLVQRQLDKQRTRSPHPQHRPLGRSFRLAASRAGETPDGQPSTL
ncbi:HPF/RaiA family ribosome-associated protein [Anaeromyxobacter paludicola]|uniref:Ribosome-associated translation inhibitor RaiA n=1 Tax=Anaeromyxobacter paludicola TaxID=2918171 RepID=A0ABM7XDB4_9BACT|nr:HPF/RaiA family ribosome-associated protein [Anaeromyxobacter paludicola]BDG09868.1 hypothetical protein AMPC_29810 [Anaeromyxobacter paludicola]